MALRATPSGAELNAAPEAAVCFPAGDRCSTQTNLTAASGRPCAGLNDPRVSDVRHAVPGADLARNSSGLPVRLDSDIRRDRNRAINRDVRWVPIRVDRKAAGSTISAVKVDPVLYSTGPTCRF